jgi:hypothetical protein
MTTEAIDPADQAHLDQGRAATRGLLSMHGLDLVDWLVIDGTTLVERAAEILASGQLPVLIPIRRPSGGIVPCLAVAERMENDGEA